MGDRGHVAGHLDEDWLALVERLRDAVVNALVSILYGPDGCLRTMLGVQKRLAKQAMTPLAC